MTTLDQAIRLLSLGDHAPFELWSLTRCECGWPTKVDFMVNSKKWDPDYNMHILEVLETRFELKEKQ